MHLRTCIHIFCLAALLSACACVPRRIDTATPSLILQTKNYIVVQSSPDRFVILTKSHTAMDEITKQLGCDKQRICAGAWSGEMWTVEIMK
jgi:hypothetical protein